MAEPTGFWVGEDGVVAGDPEPADGRRRWLTVSPSGRRRPRMRNAPMMRAGPARLRSSLRPGLSGSPSLRPSSLRSGGLIPGRRRTTTVRWRVGVGRVNKQLSRATSGRSSTSVPAATSSAARTDGGAAKLDLVDSGQPPARAHARRGPLVRELAGRLRGRAAGPASYVAPGVILAGDCEPRWLTRLRGR